MAGGECGRNPWWMLSHCARSCKSCGARAKHKLLSMAPPYDLIGPLARAHVEPLPAGAEDEEEEDEEVVVSALPAELGVGGGGRAAGE